MSETTLLIVPGLRGHVPEHWQNLLYEGIPDARAIPPMEEGGLRCAARVAAIDAALDAIHGRVILVAHSAGVLMVAHWAAQARPAALARVAGALLAAPPDLDASWPANYPQPEVLKAHGWSPLPSKALPFPSIVAASSNDYLCGFEAARHMALGWGSELVELGPVGHLNPAAGFGPWPGALDLVRRLGTMGRHGADSHVMKRQSPVIA
jgi:predicted alpha/beta hydrolase family esterase